MQVGTTGPKGVNELLLGSNSSSEEESIGMVTNKVRALEIAQDAQILGNALVVIRSRDSLEKIVLDSLTYMDQNRDFMEKHRSDNVYIADVIFVMLRSRKQNQQQIFTFTLDQIYLEVVDHNSLCCNNPCVIL
jgi:hypothetical protein